MNRAASVAKQGLDHRTADVAFAPIILSPAAAGRRRCTDFLSSPNLLLTVARPDL